VKTGDIYGRITVQYGGRKSGQVLMRVMGGNWLYHVRRLRSKSTSVSGTTTESALMKVHRNFVHGRKQCNNGLICNQKYFNLTESGSMRSVTRKALKSNAI